MSCPLALCLLWQPRDSVKLRRRPKASPPSASDRPRTGNTPVFLRRRQRSSAAQVSLFAGEDSDSGHADHSSSSEQAPKKTHKVPAATPAKEAPSGPGASGLSPVPEEQAKPKKPPTKAPPKSNKEPAYKLLGSDSESD